MTFWSQTLEIARVDLRVERRLGDTLRIVLPFAVVALMVFPLSLGIELAVISRIGPAVFWALGVLFGMQIALRQSVADTPERRDLHALLGVDPAARFVGRVLSGGVLMLVFLVVLYIAMVLIYGPTLPSGAWWMVLIGTVLFSIGLAELGTLAGEITAGLRNRTALASLIGCSPRTSPRHRRIPVVGGTVPGRRYPHMGIADDHHRSGSGRSRSSSGETSRGSDTMTRIRVLFGLAATAIGVGLWFALTAPPDSLQGEYSRIINVHVPSLWLAFLAFGVTALGSILWLLKKNQRWDRLASASAEIGVLFTGIGLFSGMVWGRAVWGRAWDWGDPRLTTTAVMFFVYLGYIALRNAVDDPMVKARRSAILGVVAVVQVPLVYFSVNLFRTLHPIQSIGPAGSKMPTAMLIAMLVNVVAFTILYVALMAARTDLARIEERITESDLLAGDDVKPPKLSEVRDV